MITYNNIVVKFVYAVRVCKASSEQGRKLKLADATLRGVAKSLLCVSHVDARAWPL
jgi:hypothetical protein